MMSNPNLKDPNYYGEPVNLNLKYGPVPERKKTDFCFLIFFIVFVVIYIGFAIFVIIQGDISKSL